jgi:hypothetical protein
VRISHVKKNYDLADTLFEILERWGTWKYFGVLLRNKDCRIRKLRENEYGIMLITASKFLVSFLWAENRTVEI